MATVIRSCRNMERSRRSLRRRATPLDSGRPLGSAIIVQHREKQSSRNLSEPGGGGGGRRGWGGVGGVLCVGVGRVVGGRGVCLVCVCVLRHAEKCGKNRCVDSKTPPCVHSKRPRVCRHHAHMCFNMWACCRYTRERLERTHGDGLNGEEGARVVIVSSAYQNLPTMGHQVLQRFTKRYLWILPISKFENRSRTTRSRFLQSFASPDKAVQLQLS